MKEDSRAEKKQYVLDDTLVSGFAFLTDVNSSSAALISPPINFGSQRTLNIQNKNVYIK